MACAQAAEAKSIVRVLLWFFCAWNLVNVDGAACAATSATFQVSAAVQAGCSVDGVGIQGNAGTVGTLDFGQDTSVSTATHVANLTNQGIVLRCTPGVSLSMTLDGGQHASAGVRNLQLGAGTSDQLAYRLFHDAAMNQEIGINQPQSIPVTSANMNNIQLPIFGSLSLPGHRRAGTYTDQILLTLTW
jgi:spore coat protein U-like protein